MSIRLVERAPAKINLTLHLTGRRADGYHDLESLVVFAGAGDLLQLDTGTELGLVVEGPTAERAGPQGDNLVLKAARQLAARVPELQVGTFRLTKRLPVAAGIGGGSSDAAAALRLLARLNGLAPDDHRLVAAASATGADVPVCLGARARTMSGIGDALGPVLDLPPLFGLLINPGVPLETRRVFEQIGLVKGALSSFGPVTSIGSGLTQAELLARLRAGRNDMEDAACVLVPVIGHVLAVIAAAPGCKLARMSGSGATCFGLFNSCRTAAHAAAVIRRDHPGWWVKATVLR
jgi:4-diphosphocytidyl-2-C-methyl-D-erythritol kinase